MKSHKYLFLIITSCLLLACGPDKSQAPKIFEKQRAVLDQAKQVDDKVQQQAQELQKNLEQQTQ